jgi:hypothetical protein
MHNLTFLLLILFPLALNGQAKIDLHKFSFSLEYKNKLDKSRTIHINPESLNRIEKDERLLLGSLLLNYKINSKFGLEAGYSFEPYKKGWTTKFTGISSTTYLLAHMIPVRLSYSDFYIKLFKRKLIFEPAIGLVTAFRYNDGDIGGDGGETSTGPSLFLVATNRKGIEYDIKRVFFLLDTRAQIRYECSKSFALFVGGGYSQGTSIIGRVNASYIKPPSPTVYYIKKEYRGSNLYFNAGLRVSLAGLKNDQ